MSGQSASCTEGSPVSAASLRNRPSPSRSRPSAGTTSPAASSTTSPGTSVAAATRAVRPSRRTSAVAATVACKRLEKAGLLTRERQAEDERIVRVALTEQGRVQIDDLRLKKREALAQWLNVLDQREQEELQCMVERLLEAALAHD